MDPGKGAAVGAPAGAKKKGPATVLTKAQEKEHMARYFLKPKPEIQGC
jgi:hypothetical protein